MTCSSCGYMMGPFDKECPRCKLNPPKLAPAAVSAPIQAPVAAAIPLEAASAPMSSKRSVSPLSIAISVICGMLCVIGLLLIILGGYTYSKRNEPIYTMNDDLHNRSLTGEYVSPIEVDANRKTAQIETAGLRQEAFKLIAVGGAFCVPVVLLAAVSLAKRRPR